MLWAAEHHTTHMQTHTQEFNLKQREMFTKLLSQAKARAEKEIESDYAADRRIQNEVLPKLAEEYGASDLLKNARRLVEELETAKSALSKLGFECDDDGDLSLKYSAPKALRKALEDAQRSARNEREKGLKKYDLAVLAVLASEDVQEAKKIVEGLL